MSRIDILKAFIAFAKKIRRLIYQVSPLSPYLPLLKQSHQIKLRRLMLDSSDIPLTTQATLQQEHLNNIQNSNKNPLQNSKALFSQECISPCHLVLIPWYFLVLLAMLYWFFETGIIITFGQEAWQTEIMTPAWMTVGSFFILILVLDIFAQFRIGYLNNGIVVKQRERIVSRYLGYRMFIDITVVLIIILTLATQIYALNYAKIIIILKFARIFEIDNFINRILLVQYNKKVIYVILKQILLILIISHTIGIFYYLMDRQLLNTPLCQSNAQLCWLYNAVAYTPIANYSWQIQYFYALYWGVNTVTNISYGDVAPQNAWETIYNLCCFLMSLVVCAYIINQIVSVILVSIKAKENYRQQLITYTQYMDTVGISRDQQIKTKDFLYNRYVSMEAEAKELELMDKLPEEVKNQYFEIAYHGVYYLIDFMFGSQIEIFKLLSALKEIKYSPGQCLLQQCSPVEGMFYVKSGTLQFTCQLLSEPYHISSKEISGFVLFCYQFLLNLKASYTTTVLDKALLYYIPKQAFEQIALANQSSKQTMCLLIYQLRHLNRLERIFEKCLICKKEHRWNECPSAFLDKSVITSEITSAIFEGRKTLSTKQSEVRRINKRHRIWRDKAKLQELSRIVKKNRDSILMALERRIKQIKAKKQMAMGAIEVDRIYDWSIYLSHCNIELVKQKYNARPGTI